MTLVTDIDDQLGIDCDVFCSTSTSFLRQSYKLSHTFLKGSHVLLNLRRLIIPDDGLITTLPAIQFDPAVSPVTINTQVSPNGALPAMTQSMEISAVVMCTPPIILSA